ncbi:DMT family transporter [Nocardioides sp. SYSU DS0663]|uniref:DMT family transporter n=1 Tax=Nocardioides sp. SYSU DS0663 TaxID=3416445 RepID=UPI003F4B0A4B
MTARARTGLLQVALAGVLWGTGGLGVQVVREHVAMSVLTISAWRMGIAALVLVGAVLLLRRAGALRRLVRERPGRLVAVGVSTATYQALYFGAVVTVGVTVATVVSLGLAPVALTAVDSLRSRRAPAPDRLAVLAAALTGLVLVSVTSGHGSTGPEPVLGVALAVASGLTYALATALGEPLARASGPLPLTTATTTVGAVALLPTAFVTGPVTTTDPVALLTLAYLGVLTMALAYGLLYAGLRTTDPAAAVVATLLEPVTAAVAAAVLLGERLGPGGLAGTALILAAVAGLSRPTGGRRTGPARSPVVGGPLTLPTDPDRVSGSVRQPAGRQHARTRRGPTDDR